MDMNRMVTLTQIKEEIRLAREEETGKMVPRPAYFSGMKTLLEGAFALASYFEQMHLQ